MEPGAIKLAENGFAFIAFLVLMMVFIWQVIKILSERMRDIVTEIRHLVAQQKEDALHMVKTIDNHDDRSQERHDAMLQAIHQHHATAAAFYEWVRGWREKGE